MRGSEKGRGGSVSGTGTKIPLQPWCRPWLSSCAPAARGGSWWSRDPPAACGGLQAGRYTWQKLSLLGKRALEQAPGRTCGPMKGGLSLCRGLELICREDLWAHEGTNLEWPAPEEQHFVKEMHKRAAHEELQPVGTAHCGVCGGLSLMGYWGLIVGWAVSSGSTKL